MRLLTRFGFTLLLAALPGCAKPVAPVLERPDASGSTASLARAASRDFGVRLKFLGPAYSSDGTRLSRPDRQAVFVIVPTTGRLDTVPAYATLEQVQWRPADAVFDAQPATSTSEGTGPFAPGLHELALQAPARAGGGTVLVRFFAGFSPDTWWAGPDLGRWPQSSDGDGHAVDVADWASFATSPAWPPDGRGFFGPDSFRTLPSLRLPPDRDFARPPTFYEIFGSRIYARAAGDTVHQNAWIVFCNGGSDWDSPYLPKVDATDPALPPGFQASPEQYAVLLPRGPVGSPIGFRLQMVMRIYGNPQVPDGTPVRFAQTSTYPAFLPASVFRFPQVMGYWHATMAGKAYALVRAEDSDGLLDNSVRDPLTLADAVDAGGGTPQERSLRRKVLTFWVRSAPAAQQASSAAPIGRPLVARED